MYEGTNEQVSTRTARTSDYQPLKNQETVPQLIYKTAGERAQRKTRLIHTCVRS